MASVSFAPSVPFKFSEADKKPVEDESEEDLYAKYKALLRQEEFLDLQVYFHYDLHTLCQGLLSTP